MTKIRIHADEWSKDRGYSVAFDIVYEPDDPDFPAHEEESLKELERLFGMPAQINEHLEDSTNGEFTHWVSQEKLQEIYSYCMANGGNGGVLQLSDAEVRFSAVEGHFGKEAEVDLEDWPDKFNIQDKQDSEFCTCDGPGKGFSLGRKNFVNCTKCGKPKPPDWEGDFERTGTRVHADEFDEEDNEHDPVKLLKLLIEEISNEASGVAGKMEISMLETLSYMLVNKGSSDVAVYVDLAQKSLEEQDIPTTLEILDLVLEMLGG